MSFVKTVIRYGREEKQFDLAGFGQAIAEAIGMSCEVREPGLYPVVTLSSGDLRVSLRNGYGAKFGKIEFNAWFAAETFLEHHERTKVASITVDGTRPIDAVAKDVKRRLVQPALDQAKESARKVAARRNGCNEFRAMAAEMRATYPGLSIEFPSDNATSARLYFNANECYLTGELYSDGRISVQRLSLRTAKAASALLDLISRDSGE